MRPLTRLEAAHAESRYDAALTRRAPQLFSRAETDADREVLIRLFIACSPLAAILPMPLLRQQADMQDAGHRAQHPNAMRRVVESAGRPIGCFVIDWCADGESLVVNIAVHPNEGSRGVGSHMLLAWLEVADSLRLPCRLQVLPDNPAVRLYSRLGFAPIEPLDPGAFTLEMMRPLPPVASL